MRVSRCYAWETQATIPQSAVPTSAKKLSQPADVKEKVFLVPLKRSDGSFRTTGTIVLVKKFDGAHYLHEALLLRVDQTNNTRLHSAA